MWYGISRDKDEYLTQLTSQESPAHYIETVQSLKKYMCAYPTLNFHTCYPLKHTFFIWPKLIKSGHFYKKNFFVNIHGKKKMGAKTWQGYIQNYAITKCIHKGSDCTQYGKCS